MSQCDVVADNWCRSVMLLQMSTTSEGLTVRGEEGGTGQPVWK